MRIQQGFLERLFALMMAIAILISLQGCGGSSSNGGGGGGGSTGTNITVAFSGSSAPLAVATQIGTGSWAAGTPGSSLSLTLPQGTTTYGVAYVCASTQSGVPLNQENIIQATVQDATTYQVNCPTASPSTGSATGAVDASIITGTAGIEIVGLSGFSVVTGISGTFSLTTASSTQDIAFIALDSSNNTLAVHILPSQTVPGTINNGNTVVFLPTDAVTLQTIAVSGVPSGFTPGTQVSYVTANGTYIGLLTSAAGMYPTIATSTGLQTGDFYIISGYGADNATFQGVEASMATQSPSSVTFALPAPLMTSAPAPAALPTFDVTYSGFSGLADISDFASIAWFTTGPTTEDIISVASTIDYQNGATTLAIPDLTALSGFLPKPASGTTVYWGTSVAGGSYQSYTSQPTSGALSYAYVNNENFVVP